MRYLMTMIVAGLAFCQAKADEIHVVCRCEVKIDGLVNETLVTGSDRTPSAEDLNTCQIQDGVVVSGCSGAIANAQYNCQNQTLLDGASDKDVAIALRVLSISSARCFGKIVP